MSEHFDGIAIPIAFKTNKLARARYTRNEWSGEHELSSPRKPVSGYMEIYFAAKPVTINDVDLIEPGKDWSKEQQLYINHNVYGEHQFLVPGVVSEIPGDRYLKPDEDVMGWNRLRTAFALVNGSPTTATAREELQLLPCSKENLGLFVERFQSQPFYIEVGADGFWLHTKTSGGGYRRTFGQSFCPPCWHGTRHAVITTHARAGYRLGYSLGEIRWDQWRE
ncbi:hypothetical protein [Paraburkholderia agricolaris]|jgi:hypothetical protein|uniref:hypothetical protein n=1 Tax=Paraburkholderia agricolaris TaxID=2152888 RepID=UPI0012926851|nr:hypothetical protein [Paraburkholderia agricolaris]